MKRGILYDYGDPENRFMDWVVENVIIPGKASRSYEDAYELSHVPKGFSFDDYKLSMDYNPPPPNDGYTYYLFAGCVLKHKK